MSRQLGSAAATVAAAAAVLQSRPPAAPTATLDRGVARERRCRRRIRDMPRKLLALVPVELATVTVFIFIATTITPLVALAANGDPLGS